MDINTAIHNFAEYVYKKGEPLASGGLKISMENGCDLMSILNIGGLEILKEIQKKGLKETLAKTQLHEKASIENNIIDLVSRTAQGNTQFVEQSQDVPDLAERLNTAALGLPQGRKTNRSLVEVMG